MGHTKKIPMLAVALASLLAGCSRPDVPVEAARPVLVVHPSAGAQAGFSAYAGEIRAREETALSFRIGGSLLRRLVDAGDHVRRGQLLAELAILAMPACRSPPRRRTRACAATSNATARWSRRSWSASRRSMRSRRPTARPARSTTLTRNQSACTRLLAPRDGVIANRQAEAGQTVAAGQAVYTLAGDGGREVAIALPESRIREVSGPAGAGRTAEHAGPAPAGPRARYFPAADPQARTYAARVALDGDAATAVELGQSARVYMQEHGEAAALRVPLSAVQRAADGRPASLWVVDPKSRRVRLAAVKLGTYAEDVVPVLGGVDANARVVAAGGHLLREGQLVAPAGS